MKEQSSTPASAFRPTLSKDGIYLQQHGWKFIARKQVFQGVHVYLWDHLEHRHPTRGCFTQTQALNYQRKLDKNAKTNTTN